MLAHSARQPSLLAVVALLGPAPPPPLTGGDEVGRRGAKAARDHHLARLQRLTAGALHPYRPSANRPDALR
jgi:hypothetical protein